MESFDQSLKYLLAHEPGAFLRFALGGASVEVLAPVEAVLPSRGREIDGGHRVRIDGRPCVAHVEFHRRHQAQRELALDVAEAQIRLHRRESCEVVSVVWDLYGDRDAPVLSACVLRYAAGSQSAYTRVNLRGMGWRALLAAGPPALWSLVPLTADGASEEGVRAAREAIAARTDLSAGQRADQLAVLWFVAEAEAVAVTVMRAYIRREDMTQSVLYQEIFAEGELKGARVAVADLCEALDIALTPEREAALQQLDLKQPAELRAHLKRHRAWPESPLA